MSTQETAEENTIESQISETDHSLNQQANQALRMYRAVMLEKYKSAYKQAADFEVEDYKKSWIFDSDIPIDQFDDGEIYSDVEEDLIALGIKTR